MQEHTSANIPIATRGAKVRLWSFPLCAFLLSLLVAGVWVTGGNIGLPQKPDGSNSPVISAKTGPDFATDPGYPAAEIEGIAAWLNSEPLTLASLEGKVTLLDFWTYTCVNCIRTIPQLKRWDAQYADAGLVIIGIHTPEFEFEKEVGNVRQAIYEHGIVWPVALDNDYATWDNYLNIFWPTKYLIDRTGRVRYRKVGEGGYDDVETMLRQLLAEGSGELSGATGVIAAEHPLDARFLAEPDGEVTPELYAGYERGAFAWENYGQGYVGQPEYYRRPGEDLRLSAPDHLQPHLIYFEGHWRNEPEGARHARTTNKFEDYIALVYSARSVNAVLAVAEGEAYKARITLDGEYLTAENRGADVIIAPDGESYLWVEQSRMYRVVESPVYGQRKRLQLSSNSAAMSLYAFTFGVYATGP